MPDAYERLRAQRRAEIRAEAAECMRTAAPNHTPIKVRIAWLARACDWPYYRTEDIWRGETVVVEAWEMDSLRKLCTSKKTFRAKH